MGLRQRSGVGPVRAVMADGSAGESDGNRSACDARRHCDEVAACGQRAPVTGDGRHHAPSAKVMDRDTRSGWRALRRTGSLSSGHCRRLQRFQVCHVCGKGHLEKDLAPPGYFQIEFAQEELPHLLAMADIVVSRAGATAVFELLALRKPTLYIPLGLDASRGDQIANAESLRARGLCMVLPQEKMTPETLVQEALRTYEARDTLVAAMAAAPGADGTVNVVAAIEKAAGRKAPAA